MESHSKPGMVHLGSTTAELLRSCPEFMLQSRGEIMVSQRGISGANTPSPMRLEVL